MATECVTDMGMRGQLPNPARYFAANRIRLAVRVINNNGPNPPGPQSALETGNAATTGNENSKLGSGARKSAEYQLATGVSSI